MKIVLSVFLAIAIVGCVLFGIAYVSTNSQLTTAQTDLANAKTDLLTKQTELVEVYADLTTARDYLSEVEDSLATTKAELHTANENLTEKELQLADTKLELMDMTRDYDSAIAYNNREAKAYADLRETIYQKLGIDSDSEQYITPNDLSVMLQVASVAGAFSPDANERWNDYQRMYDWVVNNITYSTDTGLPILPETPDGKLDWLAEYWKMPSETISDTYGDCEDMANLLASMILNYTGERYDVLLVIIRNQDSGHVAVALPVTGGELAILDPAGNYYSGMSFGDLQSSTTSSAISTWLSHWSDQMPGAQITAVYSTNLYQEFNSTQEFIQWTADRY
jgi:hypothetical protein